MLRTALTLKLSSLMAMEQNKRISDRQILSWKCALVTTGGALIAIGAVRDISVTGARVALEDPTIVPDEFVLVFTKNGTVKRKCQIVWRGKSDVGLLFSFSPS
jgi:hypothetical protein